MKGGGGCQTQEKLVAVRSNSLIIIADYRKDSSVLGEQWKKGVPIEVIPLAYKQLQKQIKSPSFPFKCIDIPLRMAVAKSGPCVTDNGNFLLDANFGLINDPEGLEIALKRLTGVVETGLFIKLAKEAIFGLEDGYLIL